MKAIVFERFGEPTDVLQVRDLPTPQPGAGQVRVRMLASPVNPSDLMVVRGRYGRLPSLPATPGFEGVGVVDQAGPGLLRRLRGLRPGRRVAVLNSGGGNWQEYVVLAARQLVPLPDGLPGEQGASFFVNPASAVIMTRHVLNVPAGAWLIQTAAGSALGRMVIRLGRKFGFRTANVVRRPEQAQELTREGGDFAVATGDAHWEQRLREATGGAPFAIDAVGGATGSGVLRALGPNGRLLVYGTLAAEPLTVDSRFLMVGHRRVEGFWLTNWVSAQGPLRLLALFRTLGRLMLEGVLHTPPGPSFPLDQIAQAVRHAESPGRQGKVLLRIATP